MDDREALIAEIYACFGGVVRSGVSWSETLCIDGKMSAKHRAEMRALDRESGWVELVDAPYWNRDGGYFDPEFFGIGGWQYLDADGFRYYLPASMVRCVRDRSYEGLQWVLTPPLCRLLWGRSLRRWSRLDDRQRRCVARFVAYMAATQTRSEAPKGFMERSSASWKKALDRYWGQVAPDAGTSHPAATK